MPFSSLLEILQQLACFVLYVVSSSGRLQKVVFANPLASVAFATSLPSAMAPMAVARPPVLGLEGKKGKKEEGRRS
jgi:hypothetical protein